MPGGTVGVVKLLSFVTIEVALAFSSGSDGWDLGWAIQVTLLFLLIPLVMYALLIRTSAASVVGGVVLVALVFGVNSGFQGAQADGSSTAALAWLIYPYVGVPAIVTVFVFDRILLSRRDRRDRRSMPPPPTGLPSVGPAPPGHN